MSKKYIRDEEWYKEKARIQEEQKKIQKILAEEREYGIIVRISGMDSYSVDKDGFLL